MKSPVSELKHDIGIKQLSRKYFPIIYVELVFDLQQIIYTLIYVKSIKLYS